MTVCPAHRDRQRGRVAVAQPARPPPRALATAQTCASPTFDRRPRQARSGEPSTTAARLRTHSPAPIVHALTAGMRTVRLQPNTKGAQMLSRGLAASSKRTALSQLLSRFVSATVAGNVPAASAAAILTRTPVNQSHVFTTRSPRAALHSGSRLLRSSDLRAQVLLLPLLCGARDRASTQTCTNTPAPTCRHMHTRAHARTHVHTSTHTHTHTQNKHGIQRRFHVTASSALPHTHARARAHTHTHTHCESRSRTRAHTSRRVTLEAKPRHKP